MILHKVFRIVCLALIGAISATPASACSVCFVSSEATMMAYYGTAIALSLLPIGMVGGLAYWVYRKYKSHDATNTVEIPKPSYSSQLDNPTP